MLPRYTPILLRRDSYDRTLFPLSSISSFRLSSSLRLSFTYPTFYTLLHMPAPAKQEAGCMCTEHGELRRSSRFVPRWTYSTSGIEYKPSAARLRHEKV